MSPPRNAAPRRMPWRALALALVLAAPAAAHGPDLGDGDERPLEPRVDALAPELEGVRVQVHRRVAAQIAIENPTARELRILDERGVAFLSLGPNGVWANLSSPAWYRTLSPVGGRVPPEVIEAAKATPAPAERWVPVRREPAWGWFDPRIAPPDAHHSRPGEKQASHWRVAVTLDGEAQEIRGSFVPRAEPTGVQRVRLKSAADLAPGVRVSLVPGRGGAFFLQSDAPQPVTVLGSEGEEFLRFGPEGVEANLRSVTYVETARLRGGAELALEPRADGAPQWNRLSKLPRFAWVDPRTTLPEGEALALRASESKELLRWTVPVRIGQGEAAEWVKIEGVTLWEPFRDS